LFVLESIIVAQNSHQATPRLFFYVKKTSLFGRFDKQSKYSGDQ